MKKLLEIARKKTSQAEVYHVKGSSGNLSMRNFILTETGSSIKSGYALRVIKDGKLGTAYTKNLLDRNELVDNALASIEGQVEASFSFPGQFEMPELDSFDESIGETGLRELKNQCSDLLGYLAGKVEGQVDVGGAFYTEEISMLNSSGLDVSQRVSGVFNYSSLLFPNTETGISSGFLFRKQKEITPEDLERQIYLYRSGLPEVEIPSGSMKVMFTPSVMFALIWRLSVATSGKSFYNKVSPLLDKTGRKVISEILTIYDDHRDPAWVNPRAFDDEGMPTRRLDIFEKGVFKNVHVNLDYASKLSRPPTSSGYRESMWGGDSITIQPASGLRALRIAPGEKSWDEMISSMDRGVILLGILGAHSGNIINGDFSIGMNPGLYVENGEIVGRVKDGMLAGNAYDVLSRTIAVEDRIYDPHGFSRLPCILLDDVSVTAK